ncbi:SDR family oxidoreductase [Thermaerobacillus caldiproteolyticus]|uniref:Short-subunit dehydrogenase n=1 Tax=Thermaerobacillus caldiproteolyticus TaxID=247480 RepID=A0A7W0BY39_9BACL|nr:SDR family oxidoreductase [Anoxybacillus caldiproteolyticus]MBA2875226.1 short-subunit dehydrogenase [Anoxybacillus caldiproteolyticus]QPA32832.1 SDR family oxidoreductase [Anoxybacillus caldiproteolyticus]
MFDFEKLRGKTIVITGASRGIGYETARQLANFGTNLVLGSRNITNLSLEGFERASSVSLVEVDVSDEDSVKKFFQDTVEKYGSVDVLINSAGTGVFASILESDTQDFDMMISVNLKGTYLCSKYFGKHMIEQKNGRILNIVSIAGITAIPGCGGYCASKFGVLGLTRVLQAELRSHGVYVSAVIPGAVNSKFWDNIEPKPDIRKMISVETLAKHIIYLLIQPEDASIDEVVITPPLGIL